MTFDPAAHEPEALSDADAERAAEVQRFWETARARAGVGRLSMVTGPGVAASVPPPVATVGHDAAAADRFAEGVVDGTVSATSTVWSGPVRAGDEAGPAVGEVWMVADSAGRPRALVRTTAVEVVPLAEVGVELAEAEGFGDVAGWRAALEADRAARGAGAGAPGSEVDAPEEVTEVLVERFTVLYP